MEVKIIKLYNLKYLIFTYIQIVKDF